MPAPKGNYSRTIYDESAQYVATLLQVSKPNHPIPLVDADYNDQSYISMNNLRRTVQSAFDNACDGDDAFKVAENVSDSAQNFKITGGSSLELAARAWVGGYMNVLIGDWVYNSDDTRLRHRLTAVGDDYVEDSAAKFIESTIVHKDANGDVLSYRWLIPDVTTSSPIVYPIIGVQGGKILVSLTFDIGQGPITLPPLSETTEPGKYYRIGLSTPMMPRVDGVYLDVYLQEWGAKDDNRLYHVGGVDLEAMKRLKVVSNIEVLEYIDSGIPIQTVYKDNEGNFHYRMKLADLQRAGTAQTVDYNTGENILADNILDTREIWFGSSQEVRDARVRIHEVDTFYASEIGQILYSPDSSPVVRDDESVDRWLQRSPRNPDFGEPYDNLQQAVEFVDDDIVTGFSEVSRASLEIDGRILWLQLADFTFPDTISISIAKSSVAYYEGRRFLVPAKSNISLGSGGVATRFVVGYDFEARDWAVVTEGRVVPANFLPAYLVYQAQTGAALLGQKCSYVANSTAAEMGIVIFPNAYVPTAPSYMNNKPNWLHVDKLSANRSMTIGEAISLMELLGGGNIYLMPGNHEFDSNNRLCGGTYTNFIKITGLGPRERVFLSTTDAIPNILSSFSERICFENLFVDIAIDFLDVKNVVFDNCLVRLHNRSINCSNFYATNTVIDLAGCTEGAVDSQLGGLVSFYFNDVDMNRFAIVPDLDYLVVYGARFKIFGNNIKWFRCGIQNNEGQISIPSTTQVDFRNGFFEYDVSFPPSLYAAGGKVFFKNIDIHLQGDSDRYVFELGAGEYNHNGGKFDYGLISGSGIFESGIAKANRISVHNFEVYSWQSRYVFQSTRASVIRHGYVKDSKKGFMHFSNPDDGSRPFGYVENVIFENCNSSPWDTNDIS